MDRYFIKVLLPLKTPWVPWYYASEPLSIGTFVKVQLSGRKYTGVVCHTGDPQGVDCSKIRSIISVERLYPPVTEEELKLWNFISTYYLCAPGEVYKAAYPALKVEENRAAQVERLRERLAKLEEEIQDRLSKKDNNKRLSDSVTSRLLDKQEELQDAITSLCQEVPVPAAKTPVQKPVLFQGSERLQTYIKAIAEQLKEGRQVLIMSPEKAFCSKMEASLREAFADKLHCVYSDAGATARGKASLSLRRGESCVILGARSAIFLPFTNLSLVIIDEEQDPLYKQNEPSPRYHGRDCAIMLASIHSASVLLGSSFASLESISNCAQGKYSLQQLPVKEGEYTLIDIGAERSKNGMIGPLSRKLLAQIKTCKGRVLLIRGFERAEELQQQISNLGLEVEIYTLAELKRQDCEGVELIALLSADAFTDEEDFRADEKAIGLCHQLLGLTPRLTVQARVAQRWSLDRNHDQLLQERKIFGFPPFTRLVHTVDRESGKVINKAFLSKDNKLNIKKKELLAQLREGYYLDVDPA